MTDLQTIDTTPVHGAHRQAGLGSSEAAAAVGLDPWKTPWELYLQKTLADWQPAPPNEPMKWGTRLEAVVADAYQEETGRPVVTHPRWQQHETIPWMFASVDRMAPDRIVEIKTARTDQGWGEPGTDQCPEHVLCQVHHQMEVMGIILADVPVLIGGSDFRIYTVERSLALTEFLVEAERKFWARVQDRQPPDPDFSAESTLETIRKIYGVQERAIELSPAESTLALEYLGNQSQLKALEKRQDELKAQLLFAMAEANVATGPDGLTLKRKSVSRKGYEVQPTNYVSFSIKKKGQTNGDGNS